MTDVGMHQNEGGQWNWTCGCGQSGTPTTDRDVAREAFKQHRRTCSTGGSTESQQPVAHAAQPRGEKRTMSTTKKVAGKANGKKDSKTRERAVSEKEALSVIEKLKAGKSSVMAEARRLGCYHATLRKALRAAIGEKAYDKLMATKKEQGRKAAPKKAAGKKTAPARKRSAKKADAPVDVPVASEPAIETIETVEA